MQKKKKETSICKNDTLEKRKTKKIEEGKL